MKCAECSSLLDGIRPVEKSIWMEEHIGCACLCTQSPDSCDPVKQIFNLNTCQCECKKGLQQHDMKCGGKFKVSYKQLEL